MSNVVDELYQKLNKAAEELTEELGRPVSMREALLRMFETMDLKPNDFAWSLRMRETNDVEHRQTDSPNQ